MSELRVCQVSTMTRWGGVERMLSDLLLHSIHRPIRQYLLATSSIPEVMDPLREAGVPMFEPVRRRQYDPDAIRQMVAWLRRERIQVVHSYNAYANAWGSIAAALARVPVTITGEHGTIWRTERMMQRLDRWAQRRARWVIANSQASRQLLALRYGISPDKIRVIPNAVAPLPPAAIDRVRAEFGLGDSRVVGSIGRLDTDKHFKVFVESASLVLAEAPDTRFLLVGSGPLEAALRRQVSQAGIGDRFTMTGWRSDARTIVQAFDLFVSTSIHESFGNAIIEAALAGIPAIAPSVDGITEAVVNQQTGVLLNPSRPVVANSVDRVTGAGDICPLVFINGHVSAPLALDPAMLAAEILSLLRDDARRTQLGAAARERAGRRFSLDRYIVDLEQVYRQSVEPAFDRT